MDDREGLESRLGGVSSTTKETKYFAEMCHKFTGGC